MRSCKSKQESKTGRAVVSVLKTKRSVENEAKVHRTEKTVKGSERETKQPAEERTNTKMAEGGRQSYIEVTS